MYLLFLPLTMTIVVINCVIYFRNRNFWIDSWEAIRGGLR